ncbi:hypothetical protein Y032_0213g2281 [Ancylostoma ceylanicum]|uniref:Uncharacterized protein n=1 Tax=Ancylostoma ceylanicum TaxID=53326 RepID=A0A016SKE7_9BILA|nr:hypothetical protein Y032_0213g2281 [Ancylostoma ceylanicum]
MLGISRLEHKKNEEIREISQLHEIVNLLYTRKKSSWAEHVARVKDNRWTVRLLHWYPRTKPPIGRPPLRWMDPLWKEIGRTWTRLAQGREKWHGCELPPPPMDENQFDVSNVSKWMWQGSSCRPSHRLTSKAFNKASILTYEVQQEH